MAEITLAVTFLVTQRRISLLLASTERGVSCGPVAFRRDYAVIVKSLTDSTSFVPHKRIFQEGKCKRNQLIFGNNIRFHSIRVRVI